VEDVSEAQHALLSCCRTQRGDYDGALQRRWLAVFRPEDLSEVVMIALSKDRRTEQMLGVGDGQSYVLAVESGETVRVYTVPGR
jgi:hypothetical protein